jgi:hypothetical protein
VSTVRRRRVYTTAGSSSSSSLFSTSRTRNQNPRRKRKHKEASILSHSALFIYAHQILANAIALIAEKEEEDKIMTEPQQKKKEQRSDPPSPLLTKLIKDSSPTKNLDNNSCSRRRRRDGVAIARLHGQPFDRVGFCLGWGPRPCALRAPSPSPLSRTHSDANDGNTHRVEQSQCFFRKFCL